MRAPPDNGRGGPSPEPPPKVSPTRSTEPILTEGQTASEAVFEVGELFRLWVGAKLDQVDDLVAEAEAKTASLPDLRVLREMTGEWLVLLYSLQHEVGQLKAEVSRLQLQLRGRRR